MQQILSGKSATAITVNCIRMCMKSMTGVATLTKRVGLSEQSVVTWDKVRP